MLPPNRFLQFEASANLQRLIGRELVSTDDMALIELVKNSYDAAAETVIVTIQPQTEKEPGHIYLRDDGQGMHLDDFRRLFMMAGYSERDESGTVGTRIPLGEKGIGRFAADRLGKSLTVITKRRDQDSSLEVEIDWEEFGDKTKKFNEVSARFREIHSAEFSKSEGGTLLKITRLRAAWDLRKIDAVRRSVSELIDPYHKPTQFQIEVVVPHSTALTGPISQDKPVDPDIEVDIRVTASGRIRRKLRRRGVNEGNSEDEVLPSVTAESLAGLTGKFLYWLKRPTRDLTKGLTPGVRLYRDGFRVEPFGSPSGDWLGIAEKRAKRAGHAHVVPSRLLGFVEIFRRRHVSLRDTTSRQALIESDAARALVTILREQVAFLEDRIRRDVAEPRWKERQRVQAIEYERSRLQTLGIMAFGLAHELRQPLQSIRSAAGNITTRLAQLKVSDPDIRESQAIIDEDIERIDRNIHLIADISRGSYDDTDDFDFAEAVREQCELFKTRCAAKGIDLETEVPSKQMARLNRTTVSTVLFNLLQNSMDAIEESRQSQGGRIIVRVKRSGRQHFLEVADNGPGIPDEIRAKVFKKFASKKTGGMGVGLYYCKVIITSQGGDIEYDTREGVGTSFRAEFMDKGNANEEDEGIVGR